MSSKRKLQRRNPAPVAGFKYERMYQTVSEQAIYRVLAVAVDILWNNFGGLQPKHTRLKFFAETFRERLEVLTKDLRRRSRQPWMSCNARLVTAWCLILNNLMTAHRVVGGLIFFKIHKEFTKA